MDAVSAEREIAELDAALLADGENVILAQGQGNVAWRRSKMST
jgi:hypothetical protein